MATYRELSVDLPEEYQSLKRSIHQFAKEVLRPAGIALDRMSDPQDAVAANSPLRQVLGTAYRLGYHTVGTPA